MHDDTDGQHIDDNEDQMESQQKKEEDDETQAQQMQMKVRTPPKAGRVPGYAMLVELSRAGGFDFLAPQHQYVKEKQRGKLASVATAAPWKKWLGCVYPALYVDQPLPESIMLWDAERTWDVANLTVAIQLTAFVCGWTRRRALLLEVRLVLLRNGKLGPGLFFEGQRVQEEVKVKKCKMDPKERSELTEREEALRKQHKKEDDAEREKERLQDEAQGITCSTMEPLQREDLRYG
jgi:hypothetical protein